MLTAMDHVNIRTANLGDMVRWYKNVLGMPTGPRPDFPFPGAWLYVGDQAVVHLVGVETQLRGGGEITLEHFAFRAIGMAKFLQRLEAAGVAHSVDPVPGFPVVQVNLHDPDGNHIHVDFAAEEASGV